MFTCVNHQTMRKKGLVVFPVNFVGPSNKEMGTVLLKTSRVAASILCRFLHRKWINMFDY